MLLNAIRNPQENDFSATYAKVKINNVNFSALIDSGAALSLISSKTANMLEVDKSKINKKYKLITANKQQLKLEGITTITVTIGKLTSNQECIIVDDLSVDVLLATDFCQRLGAKIDYDGKILQIGRHITPIFTKGRQTEACIVLDEDLEIKANSSKIIWCKSPIRSNILVEGLNNKSDQWSMPEYISNSSKGKFPLVINNRNPFKIQLHKDKVVAHIQEIKNENSKVMKQKPNENASEPKLVELINWGTTSITQQQKQKVMELIHKYQDVFSKCEGDLGYFDKAKFVIDTGNSKPIKQRAYRIPYAKREQIDKMVNDMLKSNVIRKSSSPWASPIVLVKKKDGSERFCVDFRKLNEVTIKDSYPLPLIDETLEKLRGAKFFTTLDLASGYWQMALDEESKQKTGFITHRGLYEYNVIPFGLSNAGPAFQRNMETVIADLTNSMVYIDDIMTYSMTFDEHLIHLEELFKKLKEANLKVKTSKCEFCTSETKFLGYEINSDGIRPDSGKIESVKKYPEPRTRKEVKRFLGLASYYRKFIPDYSTVTEPINRLLKKDTIFEWTRTCQKSFDEIKERLVNPPILAFPDFRRPFQLNTDASGVGIGAVLSQVDDEGNERVIAYASRMLKPAERNYPAIELECLAIYWACEHFRPYLYGRKFKILSDHNPLAYLENMKTKSKRINKWRLELAEYEKEIIYKKGINNQNADALSRMEAFNVNVENPVDSTDDKDICLIRQDDLIFAENKELIEAQLQDEEIAKIDKSNKNFKIKDRVLYKYSPKYNDRIVIPKKLVESVLKACHDDIGGGHLGRKKTWYKVKERYYWRTMYGDVHDWVSSCSFCSARKNPLPNRAPLMPINEAVKPFDMVGVDILGPLPVTTKGNKYILVFTDYLTRWVEAFPMKNMEAKTVAKIFIDEIVTRFSAPIKLLSDQGTQFMSKLVKETCEYMSTQKLNTTAYHPQTNGVTERFNKTICQLLSIYCNDHQTNWDDYIKASLFAYRISPSETTLKSPFELLQGRTPRLPNNIDKSYDSRILDFDKTWRDTYDRIKSINKSRKEKYDVKLDSITYKVGDVIRLHNPVTKQGLTAKLRNDNWVGPYEIIEVLDNNNVKIKLSDQNFKIVHANRVKLAETKRNVEPIKSCLKNNKKSNNKMKVNFGKNEIYDIPNRNQEENNHNYNLRRRKRI